MVASVLLLSGLLCAVEPGSPHPAPHVSTARPAFDTSLLTRPDRRVRTTNLRVQGLLMEGVGRSSTFAELVTAVNRTDVIVYIEVVPYLPHNIAGRLLLVPLANHQRYLRIQVAANAFTRRDAIALIGHELRHALEIADEPHVRSQDAMIELYERIGRPNVGVHAYDTVAAQDAGRKVRAELAS
jgi:hypothetical protein